MGVIVDTNFFIAAERRRIAIDFSRWAEHGEAYISAITVSELMLGVHLANSPQRRVQRNAFVEAIINRFPSLAFDAEVAKTHAQMRAAIPKQFTIGAHDLIVAATAMSRGFYVMTANEEEFGRIPGLKLLSVR